jgi:hypothetical protein
MKTTKWTLTTGVFTALLALSLYGCYFFIRMPTTRSKNVIDLYYTQTANYNYTALVKPSLLYENRTKITTDEPLYTKLVEQLDITLQYNLTQNPNPLKMTDTTIKYEASASLSGSDWVKTYPISLETSKPATFTETYTLNITEIEGTIETIGEETGNRVYSYTYEINPQISLTASAVGKPVEQEFNPTLTLEFEGGKITFEGLSKAKPGSVTHMESETATWRFGWEVGDMKAVSIITSIAIASVLIVSVRNLQVERAGRTFLERLNGDIRDKIVETSEPPERIERATVKVSSLADLAKVAEEAFKPIIHHGNVFYVLDGDQRYEFTLKETVEDQGMKREIVELGEPTLKRVECPYLNSQGKSCSVVAFGPTEAIAYRKLEAHIEKEHPDKLKEFKDAHVEHRT